VSDDEPFAREVERKAQRIVHARRQARQLWQHIAHMGVVGVLFAGPLVASALAGHAVSRRIGRLWPALVGLGFGLVAGGYATWRYLAQSLEEDAE